MRNNILISSNQTKPILPALNGGRSEIERELVKCIMTPGSTDQKKLKALQDRLSPKGGSNINLVL